MGFGSGRDCSVSINLSLTQTLHVLSGFDSDQDFSAQPFLCKGFADLKQLLYLDLRASGIFTISETAFEGLDALNT
jgi:hypothetical protein